VAGQRGNGIDQHLLGDAAHLGDALPEPLEIGVVGADDML
jgi:hypothetical protein